MAILMDFLCHYNEYILNNDFQSVYYAKAIKDSEDKPYQTRLL